MKLFMSREDLIIELSNLAEDARSHVPCINFGGCCVFAVAVVKMLNKLIAPERVRIKLREYNGSSNQDLTIEEIKQRLHSNSMALWNEQGVTFNHVFLEINIGDEILHYDSDGIFHLKYADVWGQFTHSAITVNYIIREGVLSLEDAEELANQTKWNKCFERWRIPHLQAVIDAAEERILYNYQWEAKAA